MVKKQVHTMETAEKIATGGDWYISLWTADAKVWVQENGGVHVVSESAWGVWKQLERRAAEGDNRPHSERGVSWTKEEVTAAHNACIRELLQEVNVHGKVGRQIRLFTIEKVSKWAHSGIKKSVINFARRKSCGKQREMKKWKSRGRKRMRGRQYRKSSIKKDSGGEDWMELDWTRQLKSL
jgi:hypothetical protein